MNPKEEKNIAVKKKSTHHSEKTRTESDSQEYWLRFVKRFSKVALIILTNNGFGRLFLEGSDMFYWSITICFRAEAIIELLIYLIWFLISMM